MPLYKGAFRSWQALDRPRQHAHRRATQLQQEANDLRRGSRSVTIYQSETLVAPEFIDRKA